MENLNLDALVRSKAEKLKGIRSDMMIPGIVYGHNEAPISLKVNYSDFLKTYRKSGVSHLINLKVGKKDLEVLVHQIQKEPITGSFLHIDFYAITRGQLLTTKISLNFVGESLAIREGAILSEHFREIEVKCLPKNLVDSFDVDLSILEKMGDYLRISDLVIDTEKYTILNNHDDIVVTANAPAKIEKVVENAAVTGANEVSTNEEKK